jgi:putative ABC transport system permease protein
LLLFLSEAMVLAGTGGMAGIVCGIAVVLLLKTFLPALPVELAWSYLFAAFGLSLAIGLLAGVAPALRAARLDPIESLRAE